MNECLLNNGHGPCQGTCHNLNGTYECTCTELPGYKLGADNHTCEDVDECAENNAGCSHTCLNTPGSVYCLCPDGYTLAEDWKKCYGNFGSISYSACQPRSQIQMIQFGIYRHRRMQGRSTHLWPRRRLSE